MAGGALVDTLRVDMAAVFDDFVVQVRAGCSPGCPDFADGVFLLYALAVADQDFAQMCIAGAVAVGVRDFD